MKKADKKKITMDDLAGMISAGTKETKKFVRKEIGDLAGMVQRGFAETAKKSDLESVRKDVATLKSDVSGLKEDVTTLKNDVASLKEDFHKTLIIWKNGNCAMWKLNA